MKFLIVALFYIGFAATELDTEWWKHTTIYELIISSFKDSNGDGIGDIRGVMSKLDHFVDLGIETIYFTPCFESPMIDMGYDISDYYKIYHKYGTIEDFSNLMKEMKARGLKLMLDLVINHSSDINEWFQKSVEKIHPYTDYYIWANASGFDDETSKPLPPNGWQGIGGSSWEWNTKREQFYYHAFLKEQPDLNLRNKAVKTELKQMIKFWMDNGVAGFRLDAPMFYMEPENLEEEVTDGIAQHEENIEFIHEMRLFLDEYNRNHGGIERIFAAEARVGGLGRFYDYFGSEDYPVTHFAFEYLDRGYIAEANELYRELRYRLNKLAYLPVWVTEGHDGARIGSRMMPECADIFAMMTMMLPGSVCLYYGQEIAMRDGFITKEQIRDGLGNGGRDSARLIMQWDDSMNAGFSSNITTYLPANPEYPKRNVKKQKNQEISHYNLIKTLSALRKTKTLRYGDVKIMLQPPQTIIIWRTYKESETYIFVANFDRDITHVNLKYKFWDSPDIFKVAAASVNSEHKMGDEIRNDLIHRIPIRSRSSILITMENLLSAEKFR